MWIELCRLRSSMMSSFSIAVWFDEVLKIKTPRTPKIFVNASWFGDWCQGQYDCLPRSPWKLAEIDFKSFPRSILKAYRGQREGLPRPFLCVEEDPCRVRCRLHLCERELGLTSCFVTSSDSETLPSSLFLHHTDLPRFASFALRVLRRRLLPRFAQNFMFAED